MHNTAATTKPARNWSSQLQAGARLIGATVSIFGLASLAANALPALPTWLPPPKVALFLLIAGLALFSQTPPSRWPQQSRWRVWLAMLAGLLVLGIAASETISLAPYSDTATFSRVGALGSGVLVSLSLLLLNRRSWLGALGWLAACVILTVSLYVLIDYLYALGSTSFDKVFRPMTLGAAVSYTALGLGLLLSYSDFPPALLLRSPGPGGIMLRRLLLPVLTLPLLMLLLLRVAVRIELIDLGVGYSLVTSALIVSLAVLICRQAVVLNRMAREARQNLGDAQARLSLAMDIASVGYWEWDPENQKAYFSPEWKRLLGYADHELPSDHEEWLSRLHPDDQQSALTATQVALTHRGGWDMELRLRHRDGNWRWFLSRGLITRDDAGQPIKVRGVYLDITERKHTETRIRQISQHDPLTDLPNRALIHEFAQPLLAAARRDGSLIAVLFVDLDRFKPINDEHGHAVGDEVLKKVARRLRVSVREADLVGRLGGDEFLVLLVGLRSDEAAARVARVCLKRLNQPYQVGELKLHTTPSIGISMFPRDGKNMETLIRHADEAMYEVKHSGRNNFRFYGQRQDSQSLP